MSYAEAQTPDGSKVAVAIHNALERTERQLSMLGRMLNTVAELASDNKSPTEGREVPLELRKKAEDSAIRLLHQIDNLTEDMQRWQGGPTPLEKQYEGLLEATAELQKASAFEAQIKCLPSARYGAHLHEYAEGRWGAYLVQRGEAKLLGSGSTPQEAVNAFDRAFVKGDSVEKKARRARKKLVSSKSGPKNRESTSTD